MKEDNKDITYIELTAKYLSGNATDAEQQQLEAWVLSSPENKAAFLAFQKTWSLSTTKKAEKVIDVNKEWESIAGLLKEKGKVVDLKPKRSSGTFLKIAAAVAVLLVASFWLFLPSDNSDGYTVISESEVKEQEFSDGTQIALNQYSTATYSDGEDGTRQMALNGDAFFDVARDTDHPFIINTQNVEIKVLGTSFYVDSRVDQNTIQVIVSSGTVAMKVGNQKVVLTKGEVGTYVKSTGQLTEKQNKDENYMAWKTGRLVYENDRLEKVLYDLNRTFHAEVSLSNPELKNCTITATYEGQSLEAIIRIIEKTLTLKATIDGKQIVISGGPCD